MRFSEKVIIVTKAFPEWGMRWQNCLRQKGHVVVSEFGDGATQVAETITKSGGVALAMETNVSDVAAVQHFIDHNLTTYGKLDILVNNAWHHGWNGRGRRYHG